MEIKDFRCTYQNSVGISEDITKGQSIEFPKCYVECDEMIKLALAIKEYENASFVELPFCHTVEAEAMGGIVNLGDDKAGPRAKAYVCASVSELLNLKSINFNEGRISELLKAIKVLIEKKEDVVVEVSGIFSILNVLIDPTIMFKTMRKEPEIMLKVYEKIGTEILRFIEELKKVNVHFISYADSSASVSIIGPKLLKTFINDFGLNFIKKLVKYADDKTMIMLCPKISIALICLEYATFHNVDIGMPMKYFDAMKMKLGEVHITGQMCIKNKKYVLEPPYLKELIIKGYL